MSAMRLLRTHIDDIILIAPPHRIRKLLTELLQAIQAAGFIINTKKSQMEPVAEIDYLGIHINLHKRFFRPSETHLRALALLYRERFVRRTIAEIRTVKGFLAFLLSITLRQYALLRNREADTISLLYAIWKFNRLAIPLRPPRKPPPVHVDATPWSIAYYDPGTRTAECIISKNHQAHNELLALLWTFRRFANTHIYYTDAVPNLCLHKRSTFALAAKILLALNVQIQFIPGKKNLADKPSRSPPGIYRNYT